MNTMELGQWIMSQVRIRIFQMKKSTIGLNIRSTTTLTEMETLDSLLTIV